MDSSLRTKRLLLAAFCLFIFYLSSRADYPDVRGWYPAWLPEPNLVVHFLLYAELGALAWNDFRSEPAAWLSNSPLAAAIFFCALYGLSDEIHQVYVPGRVFQVRDLAADFLGGAFGATAWKTVVERLRWPPGGVR